MRRGGLLAVAIGLAGWLALPTPSAGAADLANVQVRLQTVATGLKKPLALAWKAGDPLMYVAEQGGRVRVIANGRPVKPVVLRVAASKGGEQGLLGMTFTANGQRLIVNYTDKQGATRVVEYPMIGRKANKKAPRQILFQAQPFTNHNGGQVIFGPDGMLYIALGDGGSGGDPFNNAQRKDTLLGKILRINPVQHGFGPYSIPAGNPFIGQAGARPEIWMYGLRNPFRFTFDRLTGDLWIGDVGQQAWEEVDFAAAGESGINWGWKLREGAHQFSGPAPPGNRDPILERSHALGDCAVTGGYVYRGTRIPLLQGAYIYGDFCTGRIHAAVQESGVITQSKTFTFTVPNLTSFGQDPSGELYAVSRPGTVYKLIP